MAPYYVAQAGLELKAVLPQPPKCWDYWLEAPHRAAFLTVHKVDLSLPPISRICYLSTSISVSIHKSTNLCFHTQVFECFLTFSVYCIFK